MPSSIYIYCGLACLALLLTVTFMVGPYLPEPFHMIDGGNAITFGIVLYAASILMLVVTPTGIFQFRDAFRSRFRVLLIFSTFVVIAYCIMVSLALYSLSRSTDL
jgi:hypothetical protein